MNIILTWEDMARALDSPLEPSLKCCLQRHFERLSECQDDYDLRDLASFVIVAAGDTLEQAESAFDRPLVSNSQFAFIPELLERHGAWLEATFILSDDGYGCVLLVKEGTAADPRLMQAFQNAFADNDSASSR